MDKRELQQFGSYLDRTCEGITRRDLLKVGAVTFLGLTLPEFLALRADAANAPAKAGSKGKQARDVSVILLWMGGGPSHVDTFDPKPDAGMEIKGPFEAIETNVDGIFLCEHLPKLAQQMDKMAILRSVTHGDGAHERAQHYLQTGYLPLPTMEFPSYGSIIAKERGIQNNLPPYITMLGTSDGMSAGFLGGSYNPFYAGNPAEANYKVQDLVLPKGVSPLRMDRRRRLLAAIDGLKDAKSDAVRSMDSFFDHAYGLITSKESQEAFEIGKEDHKLRDMYGRTGFGQSCLLARRLVAAGVRFVTITMGGWDTHSGNFGSLKNGLLPDLDRGFSALLTDLHQRGMLDTTLVIWMGEFGRTPQINKNADPGRDHWPNAMSVVMAGGGVKGGQVIGKTDERAMGPAERPIHVEDLAASI
ncbi:MAG TPA: DUF1501 domain-containing protein, partial [Chthonomonadaceae bacterium]|nr:DUF1501 domain-containing protein [Chthonomonadaceae bacterium]